MSHLDADATDRATSFDAEQAPRRAFRSSEGRLLGGVAAGLADHLGLDVLWVRVGFLVAATLGGFGVACYAGLWMVLPTDARFDAGAPGLDAATRQGKRPGRPRRLEDVGPLVALAAIALGVLFLARTAFGGSVVFWPVVVGAVGMAVLWRQADEAQRERWSDTSSRIDPLRAVLGSGGVASYARILAGVGLLLAALVLFAAQSGQLAVARGVLVAGVLGVVGLAITVGPWLFRLAADLGQERAERVRSQERADVAAHLHDSVLQTLALIQKHADDGRTVAKLARAQERDLREWLYGDEVRSQATVASALRQAAADVEDTHGVPVEVVTVADTTSTDRTRPLVLAAREAIVNAARHSGAEQVDVYAEMGPDLIEVFVRDRGCGFDPEDVPPDRQGVRGSIVDRMRRRGGHAEVRSVPGEGTEVRLAVTPGAGPDPGPDSGPDPGPDSGPDPGSHPGSAAGPAGASVTTRGDGE